MTASEILLSVEDMTLLVGQSDKLSATVQPDNVTDKTITWTSDNAAVATVDEDGTVTAVSVGVANITATCGTATATCKVTVNPVTASEILLSVEDMTLLVGQSDKLSATVKPDNVTDKAVTWTSDNTAVATVDEDGTVTAVSVGVANITATCGSATATCKVTVNNRPQTPKQYVRKGDGTSCTFIVMMNLSDNELKEQKYNFAYGYTDMDGADHIIASNDMRYCHTSPEIYNDSKYDFWAFAFWKKEDGTILSSPRRHLDGRMDDDFDASGLNDYLGRSVEDVNPDNWITPTSTGAQIKLTSFGNTLLYIHTVDGTLVYTRNYESGVDVYDEITKDQLTPNVYIISVKSGDILTSKKIIIR